MKKSAVNAHLFFRDIRRSWPIWVGMSFIYVTVYLQSLLSNNAHITSRVSLDYVGLFVPIADFLLVLIVFGFMNNARSANFFFSLPIKRGSLFLTKTLACVTVTFIPALLAGLIGIIGRPGDILPVYLMIHLLLEHVTFLGTALFCMAIIGQSVAFAAISTIFQFTAYGVNSIISAMLSASIYGFNRSTMGVIVSYLTPVQHFIGTSFYRNTSFEYANDILQGNGDKFLMSALMALGGLILGILAFFAFKKRKAESAGDIVVFKFLQPVFKYGVAFCSSLLLTMLLLVTFNFNNTITHSNLPIVCILLAVNAAVGYFIIEMLIQKKFNVFKRTWKGCAVIAAVIVAAMCFVEFDVLGVEKRVPDIDSITSISYSGGSAIFEDRADIENVIALHEFIISKKAEIESKDAYNYGGNSVLVPTGLGGTEPVGTRYDPRNEVKYYDVANSDYYHNFFNSRYPETAYIMYNLDNGKSIMRYYSTYKLFNNEVATIKLGELCYALSHTYAYAHGRTLRLGHSVADIDYTIVASVDDELVSRNIDVSRCEELLEAVLADMRDLNLSVDEYAPPTVERPVTLMKDKIVFKREFKRDDIDSGNMYPGPQSASYEDIWASINLDTRAKNTLAVLNELGIEVK